LLWHWNRYTPVPWQQYHYLYAPPPGYYWVQADGRYLLVAAATGLVMNIILGQ
jgi:Ni/Co efflux regulator RcnB